MTVNEILDRLINLQNTPSDLFPTGIFPSFRYHSILPYKRADDNVYFTSFIIIRLKENLHLLNESQRALAVGIIEKAESGLHNYRNRFGDVTYNFYRPDGYFPNGKFLSKFKTFQPTDDSDDTAIAYRAQDLQNDDAFKAIGKMRNLSNGKRGRWNKRSLKSYRHFEAYNTWIGSEELYVDIDICVLANVLCFVAQYKLEKSEEDLQSIAFIEQAILSDDYINKRWALAAWYPFESVIFYQLTELFGTKYFSINNVVRDKFLADIKKHYSTLESTFEKMVIETRLLKLGIKSPTDSTDTHSIDSEKVKMWSEKFSYGVIPLLQPFNAIIFQKLSASPIFQLKYECEAQVLSFLLEWKLMTSKVD